jgi:hypothetical protein
LFRAFNRQGRSRPSSSREASVGESSARGRTGLYRRIDDLVAQADLDSAEIARLRASCAADRIVIDELRADGIVSHSEIEGLEAAMRSAREIGAAVGIVMERYGLDNAAAFAYLRRLSQAENRKLRDIAAELVTHPQAD